MKLKPVSLVPLLDPGSARRDLADPWARQRVDRVARRLFVAVGYLLILGGFFLASRDVADQIVPLGRTATAWLRGSTAEPLVAVAPLEVDRLADGFGPATAQAVLEPEKLRSGLQFEPSSQVLGAVATTDPEPDTPDAIPLPRSLQIPALAVSSSVVSVPIQDRTWNVRWIGSDVAYLEGTGSLGQGNVVLAAHITLWGGGDGPFRRLFTLEAGERVIIYSGDQVFHYRVREHRVVEPTDVSVVMPTARPTLTLLTCSEWDPELGQYKLRRAVVADLIRTERTLMR